MLTIDHLRLTLPAGFESRADTITRLVAEELAGLADSPGLRHPAERTVERLTVPPVTAPPGGGDLQVARTVARAVHGELMRGGS